MSRTVPHTVPLEGGVRSVTDAKKLFLLIQEPKPEARRAGSLAWLDGVSREQNPHPILSAEWASWDAGWKYECEANS